MEGRGYSISNLVRVMQRLRDPESGCPWDICQNFHSIVPSTLEECYELVQAIESEDYPHVAEELGDVLFQVIFYAQLGQEQGLFSFDTIVNTLVEKLLRRHPHVFAQGEIEGVVAERTSVEAVKKTWESIKQSERKKKSQPSVMADVPLALPALTRAQKVQKRAAGFHFDWADSRAVLQKLDEELGELREAVAAQTPDEIHEEMGDVLFTCVNLARHLGLDAEESLRNATLKFERRVRMMEATVDQTGGNLSALSEEQLDRLWRQVKERSGHTERGL